MQLACTSWLHMRRQFNKTAGNYIIQPQARRIQYQTALPTVQYLKSVNEQPAA
jgi:hypothetical protein